MPNKYVPKAKKTLEQRFMEKVVKAESGCWIWTACVTTSGYGGFLLNGKKVRAHRVAYELFVGEIEELEGADYRGTCVMHTCDNPLCVNPDHLVLGTHGDNMQDKAKKNRVVSNPRLGEHHQNSKLKADNIPDIRRLHSEGVSYNDIASLFGVTRATIHSVIDGTTWYHIS